MRTFTPNDDVIIKLCNIPVLGTPEDCPELTVRAIFDILNREMWRFPEKKQVWLANQMEEYENSEQGCQSALWCMEDAVKELYGISPSEDGVFTVEQCIGYKQRRYAWSILDALRGCCVSTQYNTEEELIKEILKALPSKYVLREGSRNKYMGNLYYLEVLFEEDEDTFGMFSPERFRR